MSRFNPDFWEVTISEESWERFSCEDHLYYRGAEEAAQEAFLRIWKGLPGFRREASVSTWIHTISRNTALRYARSNSRPAAVSLDDSVATAAEEAGPPSGPAGQGLLDVPYLISCLPERYRPVVILFYMEEKSYEDVSRLLDMPIGTVKTYLHRARRRLAEIVMAANLPEGGR